MQCMNATNMNANDPLELTNTTQQVNISTNAINPNRARLTSGILTIHDQNVRVCDARQIYS